MNLTGMSFTLKMDRPIKREQHYISPGGYILNGKEFDFCRSQGCIDDRDKSKVHFYVDDIDESYSEDITPEDVSGEFSEFFVYTGEYDEPEINAVRVEGLKFYFGNDLVECPRQALESANECLIA